MFFIPKTIGIIYQELREYGATIVVSGRNGAGHHFEATERSFISPAMGFKVSWPEGWVEDPGLEHTVMKQLRWPLNIYAETIIAAENADIPLPKIGIVVENVGNIDILSYTQKRLNISKTHQIKTLDYDVCEDFHTVTEIMLYKPVQDLEIYQIQKTFLRNNQAYAFNIFDLYPEYMIKKPELTTDIDKIIHSFIFFESTIQSQ